MFFSWVLCRAVVATTACDMASRGGDNAGKAASRASESDNWRVPSTAGSSRRPSSDWGTQGRRNRSAKKPQGTSSSRGGASHSGGSVGSAPGERRRNRNQRRARSDSGASSSSGGGAGGAREWFSGTASAHAGPAVLGYPATPLSPSDAEYRDPLATKLGGLPVRIPG